MRKTNAFTKGVLFYQYTLMATVSGFRNDIFFKGAVMLGEGSADLGFFFLQQPIKEGRAA
jgi:hypothetical protein